MKNVFVLIFFFVVLIYHCERDFSNLSYRNANTVKVTDTTSHDFTWTTDTLGVYTFPSVLYDVYAISPKNVWAVGSIHTSETDRYDSLGTWIPPYNAVHWDGQKWELKRIFVDYRGQPSLAPLHGVFCLPTNQIIFSSGLPYLPQGNGWKLYHLWDMGILNSNEGSVYKIWGTSLDDLYFAGLKGTIVHYDGSSWQKLESGTNMTIQDIYGSRDEKTGEDEIYCIASTKYYGGESRVMRIENNSVIETSKTGLPWSISGIWLKPPYNYYIVGDGIFYTKRLNQDSEWIELEDDITGYYTHAIRGSDINDIFMVGAYNTVIHFNGLNWKIYSGNEIPNLGFHLHRMDYRNDIVAAAGYLGRNGMILIGKRIK